MLKPQRNEARDYVLLDGIWQFRRGEVDQYWPDGFVEECELAVPASWNDQYAALKFHFGRGWYQTRFWAPGSWRSKGLRLHVGCSQFGTSVWLNGFEIGAGRPGFLPFDCEISGQVMIGSENLLVIAVDGPLDPWGIPPSRLLGGEERAGFHNSNPAVTYDFFPYVGLQRPVVLEFTPGVTRLDFVRVSADVDFREGRCELRFLARVAGVEFPEDLSVEVCVEGANVRLSPCVEGCWEGKHTIFEPRLWDVGKPELYEAVFVLKRQEARVDTYRQSFGVRNVSVTTDELLLNGKPVFLRGFGKHEDSALSGRGLNTAQIVRDLDLLRWIGGNSFRTSHYPYSEEWYEAADRAGVLVIGEAPLVGMNERMYREQTALAAQDIVSRMIDRDYHHPSVVMWSLANEPNFGSNMGPELLRTLARFARTQDTSRPITYAAHKEPQDNSALDSFDVVSINKYFGWYDGPGRWEESGQKLVECLQRFRIAFGKPVLLSEYGADAVGGLHSDPPEMFTEEYQAALLHVQTEAAQSLPWVIGTHPWAFADFKTAQSITRVSCNRKGLFTGDREPKLAAHRLRSLWASPRP